MTQNTTDNNNSSNESTLQSMRKRADEDLDRFQKRLLHLSQFLVEQVSTLHKIQQMRSCSDSVRSQLEELIQQGTHEILSIKNENIKILNHKELTSAMLAGAVALRNKNIAFMPYVDAALLPRSEIATTILKARELQQELNASGLENTELENITLKNEEGLLEDSTAETKERKRYKIIS